MQLAFVYYSEYEPSKAHTIQIMETCSALSKVGNDITLFTPQYPTEFVTQHETEIDFSLQPGRIKIPNTTIDRVRYYSQAIVRARSDDAILTRDIRFLKFLSLIPTTPLPPILYEAHKAYHTVDSMTATQERSYVAGASKVTAISNGVEEDLTKLGVEVSDVITVGVSAEKIPEKSVTQLRREREIPQSELVLVYSGNLEPWKNDLRLAIDATAAVADSTSTSIRLVILGGKNEEQERLREHARKIDSSVTVDIRGHVPHHEVFDYLKLADIGLAPLKTSTKWNTKYTSPVKIHEYLTSGLAVVASDVEAVASNFGHLDGVYLYGVDDEESFRQAIQDAADAVKKGFNRDQADYSFERRAELITHQLEEMKRDKD